MIDLDAHGAILFFGTMNAMPMMYAQELKALGQDVRYFVDVPRSDTLSRPECHWPSIQYPYADWIIEFGLPTQHLADLAPRALLKLMLRKAQRARPFDNIKAVFFGGSFISLAPFFPRETRKLLLSYGSDFDSWCDPQQIDLLFRGMRNRSIFKFLPPSLARRLLERIVTQHFHAALQADALLYFPPGMNRTGDALVKRMQAAGVTYIPRYDIPFKHLENVDTTFKPGGEKLVILSPVRFLYRTFIEGNDQYSKGNDKIIRGIARYKELGGQMEVHFFEKGEDLEHARRLCNEVGISEIVTWHKPLPFMELMNLYSSADICFDQVGDHIIGSGLYALYLGKPLIANACNLGFLGDNPIMSATTEKEICAHLATLSDPKVRADISARSRQFARANLGPRKVLAQLVDGKLADA